MVSSFHRYWVKSIQNTNSNCGALTESNEDERSRCIRIGARCSYMSSHFPDSNNWTVNTEHLSYRKKRVFISTESEAHNVCSSRTLHNSICIQYDFPTARTMCRLTWNRVYLLRFRIHSPCTWGAVWFRLVHKLFACIRVGSPMLHGGKSLWFSPFIRRKKGKKKWEMFRGDSCLIEPIIFSFFWSENRFRRNRTIFLGGNEPPYRT